MKTANIASAKSHFSRLIEMVKSGETILITERNRPVATLQPVSATSSEGLEALHASGLLSPPLQALDFAAFLAAERPCVTSDSSLTAAILEEREEGR